MSQGSIHDFGKLYRAAFAERDLEKKSKLLREVQQVLQVWQQTEECQLASHKLARSASGGVSTAA
jgi:predicted sugar kinase